MSIFKREERQNALQLLSERFFHCLQRLLACRCWIMASLDGLAGMQPARHTYTNKCRLHCRERGTECWPVFSFTICTRLAIAAGVLV